MALTKTIRFIDIDPIFDVTGLAGLRVRIQLRIDEDGKLLVAKEMPKRAVLTAQQKTQLLAFLNSLTLEDIPDAVNTP